MGQFDIMTVNSNTDLLNKLFALLQLVIPLRR